MPRAEGRAPREPEGRAAIPASEASGLPGAQSAPASRAQRGATAQPAADWPQWRGINRDGAVAAFREPATWPDKLTQQWKVDVGLGYSAPIIVGNRVYSFARQEPNEILRAHDAETGKVVWETRTPRRSSRARPQPASTAPDRSPRRPSPTASSSRSA